MGNVFFLRLRSGATRPISIFVIGVFVGLGMSYLPVFRQSSQDSMEAAEENVSISSRPSYETSCSDHVDNDGDGLTDCDDTEDCADSPACKHVMNCPNGVDTNQNGFLDCTDQGCSAVPECQ